MCLLKFGGFAFLASLFFGSQVDTLVPSFGRYLLYVVIALPFLSAILPSVPLSLPNLCSSAFARSLQRVETLAGSSGSLSLVMRGSWFRCATDRQLVKIKHICFLLGTLVSRFGGAGNATLTLICFSSIF